MIKAPDDKLIKFYLWLALAYSSIGVITTIGKYPDQFFAVVCNNFWAVIYLVILNYVLLEYSIPFILRRRKVLLANIFLAIFLLWLHAMLYSFGAYAWRWLGLQIHIYTSLTQFSPFDSSLQNQMGYSVGSVVLFTIARHIYSHVKLKHNAQQLQIEKQQAELNYLKSQTNPHFLFNTLNNIYALSRDKSDLAPESILRLSKILRYMLYETDGSYIAIEQELKIMSDYIELEKLRYDETLYININYDVEEMKQAVPPLLLIPLVENAFKHGVSESRSRPFVDIHLSVNKRLLKFVVKNSSEGSTNEPAIKENIGLSNLRRQLELLYKDFNLSVQQRDSVFTAVLKINLASHV